MTLGEIKVVLSGLDDASDLLFEPLSQIRSRQQYHDYYSMLREMAEDFNITVTSFLFHKRAIYAILFSDNRFYGTVDDLYESIELSIDIDVATYLRLKYPKFIRIV